MGLERQWDEQKESVDQHVPAGLRTFAILGIIGTLCAHFSYTMHPTVFAVGLAGIIGFMIVLLMRRSRARGHGDGLTTSVVAMLTYLMGGLVYIEHARAALVLTVAVVILLAGKSHVHAVSRRFTREDVYMALQFAAVTGIVLPLVPDEGYGPYEAFNPRSIWLMVVIVSSVGFAGYLAVRMVGSSAGITLTGLVGGLASSTATTLAMSRSSKVQPEYSRDYALAVVLACTVMLWRVPVLVGIFNIGLLRYLVPALVVMSIPGTVFALVHFFGKKEKSKARREASAYKNPLSLKVALQFAALYGVIVFAVKAAEDKLGAAGLYAVSFISGLTDVDAIALTVAKSSAAQGANVAVVAILIAAVANSLFKTGFAMTLGSPGLRWRVGLVLGATIGLGAGAAGYLAFLNE